MPPLKIDEIDEEVDIGVDDEEAGPGILDGGEEIRRGGN